MKIIYHKNFINGGWEKYSLFEQMGNIGSEVSRANTAFIKGDKERCFNAVARGLELIDLTVEHNIKLKLFHRVRELLRAREVFCDYFLGDNYYKTDIKSFQKYFDQFAISAALKKYPAKN